MWLASLCTPRQHQETEGFLIFREVQKETSEMKWVINTYFEEADLMNTETVFLLQIFWKFFRYYEAFYHSHSE